MCERAKLGPILAESAVVFVAGTDAGATGAVVVVMAVVARLSPSIYWRAFAFLPGPGISAMLRLTFIAPGARGAIALQPQNHGAPALLRWGIALQPIFAGIAIVGVVRAEAKPTGALVVVMAVVAFLPHVPFRSNALTPQTGA